ncbi:hypothetical protein DFH28DRAFT_956872 [Melampsora americana]|nr:hypothetical protein DFH28DRAFT_956872 [Melampsora americana]
MVHHHSKSCCSHPNVTQLNRNRSASLPQTQLSSETHNPLDSKLVYPTQRKASVPYNNLPRYPPIQQSVISDHSPPEEMSTRTKRLPSLPTPNKPWLGTSVAFGEDYVPLNSIGSVRTINASTEIRDNRTNLPPVSPGSSPSQSSNSRRSAHRIESPRRFSKVGPPSQHRSSPVPTVEPKIVIKRFHLPTSSDQYLRSPTTPSSGSMILCNQPETVSSSSPTLTYEGQVYLPCRRRYRSQSVGNLGEASVYSHHESFQTNQTTGYVYEPTDLVCTDEEDDDDHQSRIKKLNKKPFRVFRVRKLSDSLIKFLKVGCNQN